ncbi:MAG TPA: hypothetical protein VGH07_03740 [Chthoniobacterales bacterium]
MQLFKGAQTETPMVAGLPQELWYYDRCEATTGRRFNHHWIEKPGQSTFVPNAVIHAARKLGKRPQVHNAVKSAGLERGEPILCRSGLYRPEPIAAAIDAMIADEDAYDRFAATHDSIPTP